VRRGTHCTGRIITEYEGNLLDDEATTIAGHHGDWHRGKTGATGREGCSWAG
jgi:hypothetical protein